MKKRVNQYFDERKIKRTGDYRVALKAAFVFSLYFVPYFITVFFPLNVWQYYLALCTMGVGMAGIGLAIMHDANHGSVSSKQWVNKLVGYSLNLIGGNSLSWKIQHNVLHHSFTNVHGIDEDLEGGHIMRFTPYVEWKKHHKGQHIYAWALYSFMTFSWVLIKDFKRLKKYDELGLVKLQGTTYTKAFLTILVSKIVYISYMLVVPLMLGYAWWMVLSAFLVMHLIGGLMLAAIFQPAHVMEEHGFGVSRPKLDRESLEDFLSRIPDFKARIEQDDKVLLRRPGQPEIIAFLEQIAGGRK